jgi:hypothetical protein
MFEVIVTGVLSTGPPSVKRWSCTLAATAAHKKVRPQVKQHGDPMTYAISIVAAKSVKFSVRRSLLRLQTMQTFVKCVYHEQRCILSKSLLQPIEDLEQTCKAQALVQGLVDEVEALE